MATLPTATTSSATSSDSLTSTTSTPTTTSSSSTSSTTSTTSTSLTTTSTSTSTTSTTPSTTSTSTTSASTSTTSPTSLSSTTQPSTSSLQTRTTQIITGTDGSTQTVVITAVASDSSIATISSTASASHKDETFFQNKGAVAGTFAAVGVVVAIIVIILITRTVRQRRQKRFDREMDEAAREAAGTEVPPFLDDDDEPKPYGAAAYGGHGGYGHTGYNAQGDWSSSGGGAGLYSDTASHGTYAQPPMSHESYPMHDFGNSSGGGVGPGGIFEHGSAGAGAYAAGAAAAAAGVASHDGGRSGAPSSNTAVSDSPYPAFLHPGAYESGTGVGPGGYPNMARGQQQQAYGNGGYENDVIAGGAAGMAGIGRRSSMNSATVNRMKSQSSAGALSGPGAPSVPEESYLSHYPPAGAPGNSQPDLLNRSTSSGSGPGARKQGQGNGFTAGGANFSNAVHDAAFGGTGQPSPGLPNPFTSKMESDEDGDAGEDPYGGYGSEGEEEEHRPKVLKVANE